MNFEDDLGLDNAVDINTACNDDTSNFSQIRKKNIAVDTMAKKNSNKN